ncbi:MAG: type II secretion system protein [Clostridia bacterium]|nr:type II secretion system protein [Clostridia bacterium]
MKKSNKKGFTIVELVIVIAVIGILATVLIPTFSSVVDKANKSAAEQELKNAYTLALAEAIADGSITVTTTGEGESAVTAGEKIFIMANGDVKTKLEGDETAVWTFEFTKEDTAKVTYSKAKMGYAYAITDGKPVVTITK